MKKLLYILLTVFIIVFACSDDKQEPEVILRYNLTTEVTPKEGGSISPSSGSFSEGDKVSLTAVPASGYVFKNWTGALSGSNLTTSITMSNHKQVGAVFEVEPNNSQTDYKDMSVIELGDESNFDYLVVFKESSDYLLVKISDSNPDSLENVLFYNSTSEEYLSLFYNDKGQIIKMASADKVVLLDNFNGTHLDAAVINSNGEKEIKRNIETNFNWENNTWQKKSGTKSSVISIWLEMVSLNIDAASCTYAFLTLNPFGAFNCGLDVGERIGNYLRDNDIWEIEVSQEFYDDIDDFFDFYDGFRLATGCASLELDCFFAIFDFINSQVLKPINELLDEQDETINEAQLCLEDESRCTTFLENYAGTLWWNGQNLGGNTWVSYIRFVNNNMIAELWETGDYGDCFYYFNGPDEGEIKIIENSFNKLVFSFTWDDEGVEYTDITTITISGDSLKLVEFDDHMDETDIEYWYKSSVNVNDLDLCEDDGNGGSISEGLVAYYPFNGNANDESGNGNHGNVNAYLSTDKYGQGNNAYNFQQSSSDAQYIESNSNFNFNPAAEFSFSLWFNWDGNDFWYKTTIDNKNETTAYAGLLGIGVNESSGYCYNSSATRFYLNIWNTGQLGIQFSPDGCNSTTGQTLKSDEDLFSANSWNHVVVTHDGKGNLNMYLNNELIASRSDHSLDLTSLDSKINIGNMYNYFYSGTYPRGNTRNLFSGKIDDVRIYNKTLSSSEIKTLFEQ